MAFYRTNLPTHELVLGMIYTTFFLLLATNINPVQALSFNFTNVTPNALTFPSGITFQGDAQTLNNGVIALTKRMKVPSGTKPSTGRILTPPVSLWDTAGNVASFVTSFSFVIETTGNNPTDGLMFFIAPQDTVIPPNSESARFGVVDLKNAYNQFVGVEFDIYTNLFDPKSMTYHFGINAASLISLKVKKWEWVSGSLTQVSIAYDSSTNTLSVVVTYANGKISTIAQIVDLETVLPNTVRFGISGASITGTAHDIHSWSFTASNLKTTISSASDDKLQAI